jgi:putative ABC transport system permease protein
LALGIAGNAATFSLVSVWILKPLPYPEPDRLIILGERERGDPAIIINTLFSSLPTWADYRERTRTLQDWAAFAPRTLSLSEGDRSVPVSAALVTPGFFQTLGAEAVRGRLFHESEGVEGGPRVAVVTWEYWKNRLGPELDPVGTVLRLGGEPYEVVGVVGEGFEFVVPRVGVWLPLQLDPYSEPRNRRNIVSVARLAPEVTMKQVEADVARVAAGIEGEYPDTHRGWTADAINLHTEFPEPETKLYLVLIQGAMLFVLLIACANITNLLLARNEDRQREIALRVALGAGRLRILGHLIRESMALTGLGGAAGLTLAAVGIDVLNAQTSVIAMTSTRPTLDLNVALFTLAATGLCGLVFGLVPGFEILKRDHVTALKQGGSGSGSGRLGGRLIQALVVGEIALCLTALGGGSALVRSFLQMRNRDPGYERDGLITVRFEIPDWKYSGRAEVVDLLDRIREGVGALSGIEAVALVNSLPENILASTDTFRVEGSPVLYGEQVPRAVYLRTSPEYLETLRIPLLQGRFFHESDREETAPVAIVSRALAERHFPDQSPLGRRVAFLGAAREIVGVAGDVQQSLLGKTTNKADEAIYVPTAQVTFMRQYLVVRTTGDPEAAADPIAQELESGDPDLTIFEVETMEDFASRFMVGVDIFGVLLTAFGAFALLLASLGTYGVVAYGVVRRTHEIGVRMAVGARPWQVVAMFAQQGLYLSLGGILVGSLLLIPVVVLVRRILEGFSLAPVDPGLMVGIALLLFGVTIVATVIPASRAVRVDPARVLKVE